MKTKVKLKYLFILFFSYHAFMFSNTYGMVVTDTIFAKKNSQIVNEKLEIAHLGRLSYIIMTNNWFLEAEEDVFDFNGYLVIYLQIQDYSGDTIIKARTMWVDSNFTSTDSAFYEYDRYIQNWTIRNLYKYPDAPQKDFTDKVIYITSKGLFKNDFTKKLFLEDNRYILSMDSLQNDQGFYSTHYENGVVLIYKCRFKAVVLNYNFYNGETFQILMPVSEVLEFRPATESEAEALGYEKANVVLILK